LKKNKIQVKKKKKKEYYIITMKNIFCCCIDIKDQDDNLEMASSINDSTTEKHILPENDINAMLDESFDIISPDNIFDHKISIKKKTSKDFDMMVVLDDTVSNKKLSDTKHPELPNTAQLSTIAHCITLGEFEVISNIYDNHQKEQPEINEKTGTHLNLECEDVPVNNINIDETIYKGLIGNHKLDYYEEQQSTTDFEISNSTKSVTVHVKNIDSGNESNTQNNRIKSPIEQSLDSIEKHLQSPNNYNIAVDEDIQSPNKDDTVFTQLRNQILENVTERSIQKENNSYVSDIIHSSPNKKTNKQILQIKVDETTSSNPIIPNNTPPGDINITPNYSYMGAKWGIKQ